MSDKSFVSLERRACLICCAQYETGSLLLDMRLRKSLEMHTTTGWGLCVECQRLSDEGFIALVECDPEKSGHPADGVLLKPDQAFRTGRVARLKRDVFCAMFNVHTTTDAPCVFVEPGIVDRLQKMMPS